MHTFNVTLMWSAEEHGLRNIKECFCFQILLHPAEWCSSGNWRVRGQPWTFSGLHRALRRRRGVARKTKLSNNLDVLQVELRTYRCSSLCRRSEEGAGDEGDNIARLHHNALCFGLRIGAALCCLWRTSFIVHSMPSFRS